MRSNCRCACGACGERRQRRQRETTTTTTTVVPATTPTTTGMFFYFHFLKGRIILYVFFIYGLFLNSPRRFVSVCGFLLPDCVLKYFTVILYRKQQQPVRPPPPPRPQQPAHCNAVCATRRCAPHGMRTPSVPSPPRNASRASSRPWASPRPRTVCAGRASLGRTRYYYLNYYYYCYMHQVW